MARLFTAGGEEVYPSALWDQIDANSDGNFVFQYNDEVNGSAVIKPRSGRGCYRLNSPGNMYLRKLITPVAEVFFGGAVYIRAYSATNTILKLFENAGLSSRIDLVVDTNGVIRARRGAGTVVASSAANACPNGQWVYLEVRLLANGTTGVIQVRANGSLVIDFSGDTTDADALVHGFEIAGTGDTTLCSFWDDIVLNDVSGSANNSWPGQPRLIPLRPDGAGDSTQMSRGGLDLGSNWAAARNDSHDLAFVQSATAGQKDLYSLEVPDLPAGAVINNVIFQARARVEAGAGLAKVVAKSGATESASASQTLGAGWKFYQHCLALNPADSAAWEEADLATLQVGVEHSAT